MFCHWTVSSIGVHANNFCICFKKLPSNVSIEFVSFFHAGMILEPSKDWLIRIHLQSKRCIHCHLIYIHLIIWPCVVDNFRKFDFHWNGTAWLNLNAVDNNNMVNLNTQKKSFFKQPSQPFSLILLKQLMMLIPNEYFFYDIETFIIIVNWSIWYRYKFPMKTKHIAERMRQIGIWSIDDRNSCGQQNI